MPSASNARGHMAAAMFLRHLRRYGVTPHWVGHLNTPDLYTKEERELYSYPLPMTPKKVATENLRWLSATGGVDGQPKGLRADNLPIDRLITAFRRLHP